MESKPLPGRGRLAEQLVFVVPIPEEDWPDRQPGLAEADVARREGRKVLSATGLLDEPGLTTDRWEDVGTAASFPGLVVEVAHDATIYATYIAGWLTVAKTVARVWRKMRRRTPLLSLGAIKLLCAADLHERIDDVDGVRLVEARDLSGRPKGDLTYSEDDVYEVVFARGTDSWAYRVNARGDVVRFSDGTVGTLRRLRYRWLRPGRPRP